MTKLLIAVMALLSTYAHAAELIIYPADGQTKDQQNTDQGECQIWAKDYTGFDPLATQPAAPVQQSTQRQGGAIRGAARGAAVGAIVGDSDDAKDGAAIGAVVGRSRQNRSNRAAQQSNEAAAAQQQATTDAGRSEFDAAYGACLEGRGYSVKAV
jgi:hypothetical protein